MGLFLISFYRLKKGEVKSFQNDAGHWQNEDEDTHLGHSSSSQQREQTLLSQNKLLTFFFPETTVFSLRLCRDGVAVSQA